MSVFGRGMLGHVGVCLVTSGSLGQACVAQSEFHRNLIAINETVIQLH